MFAIESALYVKNATFAFKTGIARGPIFMGRDFSTKNGFAIRADIAKLITSRNRTSQPFIH
jgi:hypothetical protein